MFTSASKQRAGDLMGEPNRCAIFGQNPISLKWGFDEEDDGCRNMKLELLQQIMALRQCGVTQFFVACDYGVGLYAAELINVLRETDPALMLFCVIPYEEQAIKWAPYLRERYFDMLEKCTHMDCIHLHAQPHAQFLAYQKIIDQSDVMLTVYDMDAPCGCRDEDQALFYARERNKPILNINPHTLMKQLTPETCDFFTQLAADNWGGAD